MITISTIQKNLLTLTEIGMLLYWILAAALVAGIIYIPPEYMYSDYTNPLIVSWNWSFMPIDVLFAFAGLAARFIPMHAARKNLLETVALTLMFCAGLMAISFWVLRRDFDLFWWSTNIWLIVLPLWVVSMSVRKAEN